MGLLNDTKSRKKLYFILTQHYQKLMVFSFVVGISWFCLLASEMFHNKTYFSENALLPGLVVREFNPRSSLSHRLESLKQEARNGFPSNWIQSQFHQLGLDVYCNNFTVHYPFGSASTFSSKNIYAILRAPKVSSTEALVISSPYRDHESIHDSTFASIALMIELAQAFRKQSYWSKDIIFLVTQFENIGFQAWLDAYHASSTSDSIVSEKLHHSSGLIQGVINLEVSTYHFSHIDIKIEGLHGQLPNLDFFNLVVELCSREQIPTSFHNKFNHFPNRPTSWRQNLVTLTHMIGLQATGLPTGGHGLFHRFGIQALTLKSVEDQKNVNLVQLGRVVEGTVRSLNNLLEKFHQSFFFYLLPSTRSYISIGLYIPPFSLIAMPVLLKALQLHLNREGSELGQPTDWTIYNIYALHSSYGLFVYFVPCYVSYAREFILLSTEDLLYSVVSILMLIWLLLTYVYRCAASKQEFEYRMCFILLTLGGFMFTLALVNISFALLFTLALAPVSLTLQCRGRCLMLHLILIHPFVLTYLLVVLQSHCMNEGSAWTSHLVRGLVGQKRLLLFTLEDMHFFGNWNYTIMTLLVLPLWHSLWSLKISHIQ